MHFFIFKSISALFYLLGIKFIPNYVCWFRLQKNEDRFLVGVVGRGVVWRVGSRVYHLVLGHVAAAVADQVGFPAAVRRLRRGLADPG